MAKHLKKRKDKSSTPEYRENYDRIFGKAEGSEDPYPFKIWRVKKRVRDIWV